MVECQEAEISQKNSGKSGAGGKDANQGEYSRTQKILQAKHEQEHKGESDKIK